MCEMGQQRHCWECARRYLVCDSARPGCRRCATSGTQCPGYDAKPKRLKWLEPGRVVSHKRKPKGVPAVEVKDGEELPDRDTHSPDHLVIPRFELRTDACAVYQGAQYCEYPQVYIGLAVAGTDWT